MRVIDHAHLGELDQLSGLRMRHVRLEFDMGSDVLAVHEIVHADHTCKFNRRMFEQRFLDLLREMLELLNTKRAFNQLRTSRRRWN
jgi:hypothetical protein